MKRLTAALVLIIAILAAAAAPYVIGMRVHTLFQQHVARLSTQIGQPVEIVSYDRGWLHSRAVTAITLSNQTTVRVHHRITHGPYLVFGWARVRSTPDVNDNTLLSYYFADNAPAIVTTRIAFDGSIALQVHSPAWRKPSRQNKDMTVIWGGARATAHINDGQLSYTITLPRLALTSAHKTLSLKGIQTTGTGSLLAAAGAPADSIHWHTETRLRIHAFLLHDARQQLRLQASLQWHIQTGLGASGDYGADTQLTITDAVFDLPANKPPFKLDQAVLQVAFSGIATQPLTRFLSAARALPANAAPDIRQHKIIPLLWQYLPELLSQDTELNVAIPVFDSNHGQLELQAHAAVAPADDATKPSPQSLLQRAVFNLRASIQTTLLQRLLGQRATLLAHLFAQRHWLTLHDGTFTLRAHLGPQGLTLNGQPASGVLRMIAGRL